MAFTTLLITVLMVTMASARLAPNHWNTFEENHPYNPVMSYASANAFANFPQQPNFPFNQGFPFNNFPGFNFPNMPPFPKLPTVSDIINQKPIPGTNYVSAGVASTSTGVRDPNGSINRQTSSTIMTNNNGKVTIQRDGQPPVIIDQDTYPSSAFEMPKFKPIKFNMPVFEPIRPIDPKIIENKVPGTGETYQGTYKHYSTFEHEVNGVKSSGGQFKTVDNDNGRVKGEQGNYKLDPK